MYKFFLIIYHDHDFLIIYHNHENQNKYKITSVPFSLKYTPGRTF